MTQGICEESQVSKVRSEAESESGDPLEERGRQEGARARACIHTARVCLACACVCPMWVVCLFRANAWCVYTCACVLCTCVECVHLYADGCLHMHTFVCRSEECFPAHCGDRVRLAGWAGVVMVVGSGLR